MKKSTWKAIIDANEKYNFLNRYEVDEVNDEYEWCEEE